MAESMNAVIYARFSSHAQNEQSIEGQLRVCQEYAQQRGYTVVGEYIDRALTGRSDDRPDFQRMIADAKKKAFKYVIVYKLDRFARNRYDSAVYKHKLKQYGVKVLSAMESIGDNPESIILEAVLEASAEYYSVDLSQKIKRGRKDSASKGKFVGGNIPIGYKSINGQLVIDEEKAPIIKWAFEQYATGVPKKEIIAELNARGIRNRAGKPYGFAAFQKALRNEKYIGVLEQCGIRVEGGCPAIIDKETFDKVQKFLDHNQHYGKGNKAQVKYLLTGKLFCGHCGAPMVGVSGTGKYETYYYYSCGNRKRTGSCNKSHEKKDFVEWYVCEQTIEYVLSPERIDMIAQRVAAQYNDEFGNAAVKELERRIRKFERDIEKLVAAAFETDSKILREKFGKQADELDAQKAELEVDLAKLRIANKVHLTEDEIRTWIKQFCNGDLMDEDFRQRIIDVFINSIYLYDDHMIIFYNIKGSKQVSYFEMLDVKEKIEADEILKSSYDKLLAPPKNLTYEHPLFIFVNGLFGIICKR